MKPLNVEKDFLEALQHSPYYLPEFFIIKQKESGWSKDAYLKAMETKVNSYRFDLKFLANKAKTKNKDINKGDIGIPLEEITGGKVKEYYTLPTHAKTKLLNNHVLATFDFSIKKAWSYNEPEPVYSNLQMVSFTIKAVEFILQELQLQAGIKKEERFFLNAPKNHSSNTENGKPVYLIYDYYVKEPTPIFDYYLFEERLRDLVLNTKNPEKLSKMVSSLFELGKEIVSLWNDTLAPIINDKSDKNITRANRLISFDTKSRNFTYYHDYEPFFWDSHKHLSNYKLVVFAAKVGHLVAEEVMETKDEMPEINKTDKWDHSTYLLYYYHIAKSEGKELTETKVEQIAIDHNLNKGKLRKKFTELNENDFTFKDHTNNKTQFRKDYELILPQLSETHPTAYANIVNQLKILITTQKTPKK